MTLDSQSVYNKLCQDARETALLGSIESLLGWDERTQMPAAASDYRAEQMTLLAGLIHERRTSPRIGEWLYQLLGTSLAADPHSDTGATLRHLKRQYDKKVKLPQRLVEELTRTAVYAQQVWVEARANNDFATFCPWLDKTFALKREQADALGYPQCRYDAMLDDYEPEALTSEVTQVLADLREQLVPLVAEIRGAARQPNTRCLREHFPAAAQAAFGQEVAAALGFDFDRGRLDVTAHPFCTSVGPHDCRITTRYEEHFFPSAFFGILHEAGHGIYDQGLRVEHYGLPLGEAVSLGIHESQSRMWENLVGRSRAFWEFFYTRLNARFAPTFAGVSLQDFYFAVNDVRPSLIRVEADEATYNLHILIRFELEQAMLNEELKAADLPGAWNEKYRHYLGLTPPNDAEGVLQDIHWSGGLIGYFPTYSLGNLYAAQFFEQADADLGGLESMFRGGEFRALHDWLRQNIHEPGQRYSAAELVQRVTGKPLSHAPLMRHLRGKFGPLYGLR